MAMGMVDVRDVAKLHVAAMTASGAAGKRFIACTAEPISMATVAQVLRDAGYKKAPSMKAPTFLLKFMSKFDPEAKGMLPFIGRKASYENQRHVRCIELEANTDGHLLQRDGSVYFEITAPRHKFDQFSPLKESEMTNLGTAKPAYFMVQVKAKSLEELSARYAQAAIASLMKSRGPNDCWNASTVLFWRGIGMEVGPPS